VVNFDFDMKRRILEEFWPVRKTRQQRTKDRWVFKFKKDDP